MNKELKVGQLWQFGDNYYRYRLITKIDGGIIHYDVYNHNFEYILSTYTVKKIFHPTYNCTLFKQDGREFLRVFEENNKILEDMVK